MEIHYQMISMFSLVYTPLVDFLASLVFPKTQVGSRRIELSFVLSVSFLQG